MLPRLASQGKSSGLDLSALEPQEDLNVVETQTHVLAREDKKPRNQVTPLQKVTVEGSRGMRDHQGTGVGAERTLP